MSAVFIGLLVSIFAALTLMLGAFFFFKYRINLVTKDYLQNVSEEEKQAAHDTALKMQNATIDTNLKAQYNDPLDDKSVFYAWSTIIRNNFTKIFIFSPTDYEQKVLSKIDNLKFVQKDYDFAMIHLNTSSFAEFKNIYNGLTNGIIMFVNASKQDKLTKTLLYDLKILGYKHEWVKIGKGIIFISK